jgi:hypothetical protein
MTFVGHIDFDTVIIITTICGLSFILLALSGPVVNIYDKLEKHAGLIGIIVAIVIFSITQLYEIYKQKVGENQAIEAIEEEIRVNLKNIHEEEEEPLESSETLFRVLNTDAYESLVQSGILTQLGPKTQTDLAELYQRIRYRNKYVGYLVEFRDSQLIYEESDSIFKRLEERLEGHV